MGTGVVIYFYHIQRTGGRSLSRSVLSDLPDPGVLWHRCHGTHGDGPVIEEEGKKIIPWCADPMRFCSDWWYSWSHVPAHQFELPTHCFTITILRDPVTRFISLYRFLRKFDYIDLARTPAHFDPHQYLRPTILDTVHAFPAIHRYQMLYHFSPSLDVDKAAEKVRKLSYWFRMENYTQGLGDLRRLLGLKLPLIHHVDGNIPDRTEREVRAELTPQVLEALRDLFRPEYELLGKLE